MENSAQENFLAGAVITAGVVLSALILYTSVQLQILLLNALDRVSTLPDWVNSHNGWLYLLSYGTVAFGFLTWRGTPSRSENTTTMTVVRHLVFSVVSAFFAVIFLLAAQTWDFNQYFRLDNSLAAVGLWASIWASMSTTYHS